MALCVQIEISIIRTNSRINDLTWIHLPPSSGRPLVIKREVIEGNQNRFVACILGAQVPLRLELDIFITCWPSLQ